ncbi:Hypothetical_protein [Hexamita inflata]|uniref:Hypothetical_protein n=1 Tax=Hexamita inflata TaxID=28002 RepID=A0ABP1IT19_9EUKA
MRGFRSASRYRSILLFVEELALGGVPVALVLVLIVKKEGHLARERLQSRVFFTEQWRGLLEGASWFAHYFFFLLSVELNHVFYVSFQLPTTNLNLIEHGVRPVERNSLDLSTYAQIEIPQDVLLNVQLVVMTRKQNILLSLIYFSFQAVVEINQTFWKNFAHHHDLIDIWQEICITWLHLLSLNHWDTQLYIKLFLRNLSGICKSFTHFQDYKCSICFPQ